MTMCVIFHADHIALRFFVQTAYLFGLDPVVSFKSFVCGVGGGCLNLLRCEELSEIIGRTVPGSTVQINAFNP